MNRKILYRGKRKDNGEWVEGNIIKNADCSFIIPSVEYSFLGYCGECNRLYIEQFEVDSKTVCQYIGVKDNNGKKIYENDIIKREVFSDNFVIGQVVWCDIGFCGFYLKYENSCYHMGKTEQTGKSEDEVIGNIFDNPLLYEIFGTVDEIEPAD